MSPSTAHRARIVCLEGPSAVGKTSLAAALAHELGAAIVPELAASADAPHGADSIASFLERHASQWQRALTLAASAPLVVIDGDPMKGLWYDWIYATPDSPPIASHVRLHRAMVERGALAFPDLYVVLGASEAQLRARRAGDPTRTRRNFEAHLRLVAPQRRYFAALQEAAPTRVVFADTTDRAALLAAVRDAVAQLPAAPPHSARLLECVAEYVITHDPSGALINATAG